MNDAVTPGGLGDAVKELISTLPVMNEEGPKEKENGEGKREKEKEAGEVKKKRESWTNFMSMSTTVSPQSQSSQMSVLSPVTSRGTDASSVEGSHHPPSPGPWNQSSPFGSGDSESLAQVLHLSVLQRDSKWDTFEKLVKARRESGAPANAQVVMDWGELVFDEHAGSEEVPESSEGKVESEVPEMSSGERKVRRVFALGDQQAVWSESYPFCLSDYRN